MRQARKNFSGCYLQACAIGRKNSAARSRLVADTQVANLQEGLHSGEEMLPCWFFPMLRQNFARGKKAVPCGALRVIRTRATAAENP